MLDIGLPLEYERQKARSVSPSTFHHVSRSFTPGISSVDGTRRHQFTFAPTLRRSLSTSDLGMTIKPTDSSLDGREHYQTRSAVLASGMHEAPAASIDPPKEPTKTEADTDDLYRQVPSLHDLAQLLRLERFQREDSLQLQSQLHRSQLDVARASRLLHISGTVQRTLGECIKAEDKHSFVNLFNAFQDALFRCLQKPTGSCSHMCGDNVRSSSGYPASFLDLISVGSRTALLDFVFKVRNDGQFIANRLLSLTHSDLDALLPGKGQAKSSDSIFGSSQRNSSRSSRHLAFAADGQTDLLASLEFGSPLETLVLAVRGFSNTTLCRDAQATDVWSTVCANLILEQKHGSEKIVPAVIQLWATSSQWPGKDRLSHWIFDILQRGMPLLDQVHRQSFRARSGLRTELDVRDDNRIEEFYHESIDSLLALVADRTGASVIPEGALQLCLAICQKLEHSPTHRRTFPDFVLTRWLFTSYLPDVITLPEAHDLLVDYFITDTARQRLLREVIGRCQRAVFDVTHQWKYGAAASANVVQSIRQTAGRFQSQQVREKSTNTSHGTRMCDADREVFMPLSAADMSCLVSALYPPRTSSTGSSDRDASRTGLHSSSSSISGFSLFQSPGMVNSAGSIFTLPNASSCATLSEEHPDNSDIDDLEKLSFDQLEGEKLREACASIDEWQTTQPRSSPDDWCMLHLCAGDTILATASQGLSDVLARGDRAAKETATEPDVQRTISAVKDLLLDDNFLQLWPVDTIESGIHLHQAETAITRAYIERARGYKDLGDFVSAHTWLRRYARFRKLTSNEHGVEALRPLLANIETDIRSSLTRAMDSAEWCNQPHWEVLELEKHQHKVIRSRADFADRLRDKMWYVAEVRTSAAYDEARSVASALKVMGKIQRPNRNRSTLPLRHFNGPKGPTTAFHLKTEAQILEILSTPTGHGGPNKLSDEQANALSAWMTRNTIENLCPGEERLQRLCLEIRKAVDVLTSDSAAMWSSSLFSRDRVAEFIATYKSSTASPLFPSPGKYGRFDPFLPQSNASASINSISSASSHPLSARSSRDYLETRSPTLTNKSSGPFWSPALTETQSPSSATSIGSLPIPWHPAWRGAAGEAAPRARAEQIKRDVRQRLTSLLLSDLMLSTFAIGSETDRAFWTGLGGELSEKHLRSFMRSPDFNVAEGPAFDYKEAFARLLQMFATTCNPFVKLRYLTDIDTLLKPFMYNRANLPSYPRPLMLLGLSVNGKEVLDTPGGPSLIVHGFRGLFSDSRQRPSTIFRDLQYIAALVPSTTLASTPEGAAFWNAVIAIMSIKQEVCQLMVETADSIIANESNNRGSNRGSAASSAQKERDHACFSVPNRTPSAEEIGKYSMAHAAELLQITAKEGDAVAQRELATLYLTHPELMDHVIAPLSRPRDVFKEVESKWSKNQDPQRFDPATMCVAHHWMSLSAQGGDPLAKEFLRQREEMDKLGPGL